MATATMDVALPPVDGELIPTESLEIFEGSMTGSVMATVNAAAVLNDAVATTFAINEAVAMMAHSIILEQATMTTMTVHHLEQPLADILARHEVRTSASLEIKEIEESIAALQRLIAALEACETPNAGHAPSFFTRTYQGHRTWSRHGNSAYETLLLPRNQVPLPTPADAIQCYRQVKSIWELLRDVEQARNRGESTDIYCSCIGNWDHVSPPHNLLIELVKQTFEQEMVREASDSVTAILKQPGFCKGDVWDRNYARDLLPTPAEMQHWYTRASPVRFLQDRDDYIANFVKLAMASKSSIKVCTCYLFCFDPAHRYILMDLLPFLAQQHGISVQIMFDLMTIESSVMKDAFYDAPLPQDEQGVTKTTTALKPPRASSPAFGRAITSMTFLEHLSSDCPAFEKAKEIPKSSLEFLNYLLEVASLIPAYQVKFWCARDATNHYRIKNHAKSIIFDCNTAYIGGSNITPTVRSASSDCDLIVTGEVARQVNNTFTFLWEGMSSGQDENVAPSAVNNSSVVQDEKKQDYGSKDDEPFRLIQDWDDDNCRIALVRSEPSSGGEDAIYRAVLGAIYAAETSITISMGHSNLPMSLAHALRDVCKRGVQVRMLHNSFYSNDLRNGQRDLFLSLRDVLQVAPDVQVWTTAITADLQPAFLHSKYVVIDEKWSCVGSWNLWTRAAFYEMEHELLIYSEKVASFLLAKFERERTATAVLLNGFEDCLPGKGFCPTGCELCRPFGPFFS